MTATARRFAGIAAKSSHDVVILSALRTPICRAYKGRLRNAYPEELLTAVLRATAKQVEGLDPALIEDVAVGTVLSELGGSKAARAALNSIEGFDATSTSLYSVNRACASSLQSISTIPGHIRDGTISVGISAGMESMTMNYASRAIPQQAWPALKDSRVKQARDCFMPMGLTSEKVARRYGVTRRDQDTMAAESHRRAVAAAETGKFKDEIVPFTVLQWNSGVEQEVTVLVDDGPRPDVSRDGLARLKPSFAEDGRSTAGNSSQISDGAAALLLMRRQSAVDLGLASSIMGRFLGGSVQGCEPEEMGVGPVKATAALLQRFGLTATDVDAWEINEAFASQFLYCVRELGLEKALEVGKVNPHGGAIALGHPLGATGARLVTTLLHSMKRSDSEVGIVSMCVGTGMGMSGLFVRE
ncbi:Acetyl-CoA C-acetyltransferase [Fusarium falciforme]|uniref:Acetyl-CoA C-acetyltransferase n=1 Tax=Fusarium falciforme TaxID=195108 RepID=UPI00230036A7|nr:Acetyl-CoA C-acetyltransferase [Fusarium falciforme]WAO94718.1 Acetyl-CoA C-acetyltransferase [Fusarium falciforme]